MRRGLVLLTAGMVAAVGGVAQAEVTDAEPVLHDGDLLLRNHSFEDGLTGWSPTNGRGGEPTPPCRDAVTTTTEWASDGSRALLLPGRPPCRRVGAVNSSVSVSPGQHYTAFAHVHADKAATIRLRWLDEQGRVVSVSSSTTRRGSDVAEVSASAPAAAREVQVELAAADRALFDQVLITAPLTVLDRQITKGTSYLSMAAGVDENGRAVTYAVGTGSEHDPAVLTVTDILTGEVVRNVRLPGATGAWGIRQNPVLGHGDRIYYGTQAEYGHNEGAFGWLDLATGECTTLDGVVGHQSVNTIAASGDKVFGIGHGVVSGRIAPVMSTVR
ncbi:carbohydrate binding domain-containing protein [Thermasporomyces composti]|uniref:Carbohydrate binding protein n=1 Tax=Thermasporomyces composti TaxID=696763 RepID=A0A3D9VB04_THECX|nr:carbohydrate binding domain-containing protein [Thermasporomyces composti]REF35324.1 carbohydrate binding protein [Thermasporomyces composti]